MKKMKCEVCESFSFKKENGVFVCQECGTEYSLEDAKKLLTEIDDSASHKSDKVQKREENIEKIKLEYDLLCWHNFYEKCHELENSFEIKDDSFNRCSDISSEIYEGDIANRTVTYDKSNHNYFNENIYPKLKNQFLSKKSQLLPFYEKAKREANADELRKVTAKNAIIQSGNRKKTAGGILVAVSFIFLILGFVTLSKIPGLSIFLFIVVLALAGVGGTLIVKAAQQGANTQTIKLDSYTSAKQFVGYDDWITSNIDKIEIFKNHVSEKKKVFLEKVKNEEDGILESRKELVNIRNNLLKEIPIPEKYSDEYHINCLLALVLDCRADTLKEAINLFETEAYRNTVINSLNVLNYNIVQLNNNITNLRNDVQNLTNTVYQGFSVLIKQNNYISSQIDSIRFDTRYLMIDSLLS